MNQHRAIINAWWGHRNRPNGFGVYARDQIRQAIKQAKGY